MWYYLRDQQCHGPFAAAEFKRLARTGRLRPDDLVLREGSERRFPARMIRGLFPDLPVAELADPPPRRPSPWACLPPWLWIVLLLAAVAVPAIALVSHARHPAATASAAAAVERPLLVVPIIRDKPARRPAAESALPPPGPEVLVWPRLLPRERSGPPVFPRSLAEIQATLARLEAPPDPGLPETQRKQQAALRRLMAYRYLAGVPWENLLLDEELTRTSQAGAELCQKANIMSHYPKNPGLPEDAYQFGKRGTSRSNLGVGYGGLVEALDGWMDDSDPSNIDHLGHRRWCLNPPLRKTGFGLAGSYQAMWAMDASQTAIPDYTLVAYPAIGYMPIRYFAPGAAWSVSLHPDKFRFHDRVQATLFRADDQWRKTDRVALDFHRVCLRDFGLSCCIIFRPVPNASPGQRYLVLLEGLSNLRGEPIEPIEYPVEFVAGP